MVWLDAFSLRALELGAMAFLCAIGIAVLILVYLYFVDRTQTRHAVRRNFPLIGRFRYLFEHLGEFFRQYFFALDREELPFNRAQRGWVYRAAKDLDSTLAFGSTRPLNRAGDVIFLNGFFPTLEEDATAPAPVTVGPGARKPHTTRAFFHVSAMSFGAISAPAIRALSHGARKAGIWINTGEGGLSPYHLEGGCDIVFQIGTAKYGVRGPDGHLSDARLREIADHEQVRMFEIKLSQGAKPGKGGILPGVKVTDEIAAVRGIPAGADSISPNRHREINSIDDLLDMVEHIREVTGKPTGFKSVVGEATWIDDLCEAIHRRGPDSAPDFITIDSADGGSGAAPQSLMDYMGLPIQRSLPLVVDKLVEYGLRSRIRIIASGKLVNPADVAWALCIGADFVQSARGFMFALGCIQSLKCNRNTCPTGITTHDRRLQRGLVPEDKAERVAHYAANVMREVGVIAHSCGVPEPRSLRRRHAQVISDRGVPEALDVAFPPARPRPEYLHLVDTGERGEQHG